MESPRPFCGGLASQISAVAMAATILPRIGDPLSMSCPQMWTVHGKGVSLRRLKGSSFPVSDTLDPNFPSPFEFFERGFLVLSSDLAGGGCPLVQTQLIEPSFPV